MYIFVFFIVGRALKRFRESGGITGLGPRENLPEHKIFACFVCCLKSAANHANNQLDKADAKEA